MAELDENLNQSLPNVTPSEVDVSNMNINNISTTNFPNGFTEEISGPGTGIVDYNFRSDDNYIHEDSFLGAIDVAIENQPKFDDQPFKDMIDRAAIDMSKYQLELPNSNLNSIYPGNSGNSFNPWEANTAQFNLNNPEGRKSFLASSMQTTAATSLPSATPAYRHPISYNARKYELDRYYAHPDFGELGFHPMANNDAYYNTNSSKWSNFQRSMSAFGTLFGDAFTSNYRSIGDFLQGENRLADYQGAQAMEDAMRIGRSSSTGVRAFFNDLFVNGAYTAGIVSNILLEEAALATATYFSGGGTAGALYARTAANAKRGFDAFKRMFSLKTYKNLSTDFLKTISKFDNAKAFYNAARSGTNATGRVLARIFTPSTLYAHKKIMTAAKSGENMTNLAKANAYFGGFYRDVRLVNLSQAESKMEAGLVEQERQYALYEDIYKAMDNNSPTVDQLNMIASDARQAAFTTQMINFPIIYFSNKLVLGTALDGFRPLARTADQALDTKWGGIFFGGAKGKAKTGKAFTDMGDDWLIGNVFRRMYQAGARGSAKHVLATGLKYSVANFAEGLQELAQEATAKGVASYYDTLYAMDMSADLDMQLAEMTENYQTARKTFLGTDTLQRDPALDIMAAVEKGVGSQMSSEGFKVFMSGFMMGGMIQGPQRFLTNNVPNIFRKGYSKYMKDGNWDAFVAEKRKNRELAVKHLNEVYDDPAKYFDISKLNALAQKNFNQTMYAAASVGDIISNRDAHDASIFSHLNTVMVTGKMGIFKDFINDMKKMDDKSLMEAAGPANKSSAATLRKRLDKFSDRANEIEKNHKEFNDKFINPARPSRFKKGSREYQNEVIKQAAFEHAKMMVLYTRDTFEQAIKRSNSIYTKLTSNPALKSVSALDVDILTDPTKLIKEIGLLEEEVAVEGKTKAEKELIKFKKKKLELLTNFADILNNPDNQVVSEGIQYQDIIGIDPEGNLVFGADGKPGASRTIGRFDKRKYKTSGLSKAFSDYLSFLAESKGEIFEGADLDKVLVDVIDYGFLKGRAGDYYKAHMTLMAPEYMDAYIDRIGGVMKNVYEKFKDKNEQNLRLERYQNKRIRAAWLTALGQEESIQPDPEEAILFLEKGIIPTTYYSEDGRITAASDPVLFKRVQERIEDLKKSQSVSTAEQKDAQRQESQAEAQDDTQDTKEPDFDSVVGRSVYQQYYNRDQNTRDIIKRLHQQYKSSYTVNDGPYMDLNKFAQSTLGGKNIIKSRYELDQYYQNDENIDKEKYPTMDEWLKDNSRNPLIIGTNGILTKNDVDYSDVSPELAGRGTLPKDKIDSTQEIIVSDEAAGVNLLKTTTYDENNNPEVIYTIVDGKGKNLYQKYKTLDKKATYIQTGYIARKGETQAAVEKRARKAYGWYVNNIGTNEAFNFDGKQYKTGDIVENASGKRYIVKATRKKVKSFGNMHLEPLDPAEKTEDFNPYFSPEEFRNQGFNKVEEAAVDLTSSLTTKVSQFQPLTLFGFVGAKVEEGSLLYGKYADLDLSDEETFSKMLRDLTPEQRESIEILVERNAAYKEVQPNLKNYNVAEGYQANNQLSYGQNKYQMTIMIQGKPFAIVAGLNSALLFTPEGNKIDGTKITPEQAEKLFIKKRGQTSEELAASVRRNYTKALLIQQQVEKKLGSAQSLFIDIKDLDGVELNVTPGYHGWRVDKNGQPVLSSKQGKTASTAFEDLESKTFEEGGEGYTIIYDLRRDRKTGQRRARRVPTSNLEPGSREEEIITKRIVDQMQKDGFESLTDLGMGRYVQFVTLKNGDIAYFELKLDAFGQEDGVNIVNNIKSTQQELLSEVKDENGDFKAKTDTFDPEVVGDQATDKLIEQGFYIQTSLPGSNVFLRFNKRGGLEVTYKTNDNKSVTDFLNEEDLNEISDLKGLAIIINNRINKNNDAKSQGLKLELTDQSFVPNLPRNLSNTTALEGIGLSANIIPGLRWGQKADLNFTNEDSLRDKMNEINRFKSEETPPTGTESSTETFIEAIPLTEEAYNNIIESGEIPAEIIEGIKERIDSVGVEDLTQLEKDIIDLYKEQTDIDLTLAGQNSTIEGALAKDDQGLQAEYNNQDLAKKIKTKQAELKNLKKSLTAQYIKEFKEANPGKSEGTYKLQARNAVKNQKEIKDLENEIVKLQGNLIGKITSNEFDGRNVEEINEFITWANNNLPDYIQIKDIEDLGRRLISNGITLGAFAIEVAKLSKGIEGLSGVLYVGKQTGYRYHEAFHGVFRMMLTEADINKFLDIASNDVLSLMNSSKGYEIDNGVFVKSLADARAHMRKLSRVYAEMNNKSLNDVIFEEYLADQFELFKADPRSTKIDTEVKSFFQRIIDFIKSLFTTYSKGDLQGLFNDIDSGKYKEAAIQKNRFTESALTDSTVLEQTGALSNIAFAIRKGNPIPSTSLTVRENDQKIIYINNFFDRNETEIIVGSLSANFLRKQKELAREIDFTGTYNPTELLNQTIDEYIASQDPARTTESGELYYAEMPEFDDFADDLQEKYDSLIKYKDDVVKSVSDFLNLFDIQIEDRDVALERNELSLEDSLKNDEDFEASANEIGGFKSLSKGIRIFLATRFKQVTDPITKLPVLAPVNYVNVYTTLMKALAGITDQHQMLARLKYFENQNDDTRAAIGDLFTKFNLSDYTLEDILAGNYNLDQVVDQGFFQAVIKGFTQLRSDYYQIEIDEDNGITNIFDATSKDDASTQIDNWQDHYSILVDGLNSSQTKRNAAESIFNKIEFLSDQKSIAQTKLKEQSEKISKDLYNKLGMDIAPMTIQFIILNNGIANKTTEQRRFVRAFKPTSNNIFNMEDVQEIASAIAAHGLTTTGNPKANLYYDMHEEDTSGDNNDVTTGTDVKFRIKKLAELNSIFDITVGSSVFRNAEGKLIYAHQMPTYNLEKVAELNTEDDIARLLEKPFLDKQSLLSDPRFKELVVSGKLRIARLGGVKFASLEADENGNFKASSKFNKGSAKNKSFGSVSGAEFAAAAINLYLSDFNNATGKLTDRYYIDEGGKKVPFTNSLINVTVISESNTADWISLPIQMTVNYSNGKSTLTEETIDKFEDNVIKAELNRINRERFEKEGYTKDNVLGYNDQGGRAFKLYNGKHLLSESKTKVQQLNVFGENQGLSVAETAKNNIENLELGSKQLLIVDPSVIQRLSLKSNVPSIGSIFATGRKDQLSKEKYVITNIGVQDSNGYDVQQLQDLLGNDMTTTKTNNNKYLVNIAGVTYYTRTRNLQQWLRGQYTKNLITVEKVSEATQAIIDETGVMEAVEPGAKSINDTVIERLEKEANENENFDYTAAKKLIEEDLGISIRDLIRKRLNQEFSEFEVILNNNKALGLIDQRLIKRLKTASGKTVGDASKSMSKLNLVANNPDNHNLKQIFFNEFLNRTLFKQVLYEGDPAKLFKDSVDEIKRAKALNAAGPSAASIVSSPYKFDDQGKIISGLGIDHNVDNISLITFEDIKVPARFGRQETDDKPVTSTDAQLYYTSKAFRYLMFGIGSLTEAQARLMDRVDNGDNISLSDFYGAGITQEGYKSLGAIMNSKKFVYFDGEVFLKMSAFVLSKRLTSDPETNFETALPDTKHLHNLRIALETIEEKRKETIAMAVPVSASKAVKKNVISRETILSDDFDLRDEGQYERFADNITDLSAKYMRLQQITPSNKGIMTDPSQIKQLITSEQDDNVIVTIGGQELTLGEVRELYNRNIGDRVEIKYLQRRNLIFDFPKAQQELQDSIELGEVTVDLQAFLQYAQSSLAASGAGPQFMELFEMDSTGAQKYDLNNPITQGKFQQLFFAFFKKGQLSEKVNGESLALVSSFGKKFYKRVVKLDEDTGQPIQWDVIRREDWLKTRETITKSEYDGDKSQRLFAKGSLKVGDIYLDELRMDVKEYDQDGNETGLVYSEFAMPAWDKRLSKLKAGEPLPDVISKMFGVRIPSQDKHSAVNLKLVDFLPVEYGSSAMFSNELIEISGADFDIDKLYTQMKEFYMEDGQFIEYGKKTGQAGYEEYLDYMIEDAKKKGSSMNHAVRMFNTRGGIIDDVNYKEESLPSDAIVGALSILGLPVTREEYDQYIEKYKYKIGDKTFYRLPFTAAQSNLALDLKFAMLGNKGMTEPKFNRETGAAYEPAVHDPVQDVADELLGTEEIEALLPELAELTKEEGIIIESPTGMYRTWVNNKAGAGAIGAAVLPNITVNLLKEYGIDLRFIGPRGTPINQPKFNGYQYKSFKGDYIIDPATGKPLVNGLRKQYLISALVTAATDNGKLRLLGKLGLTREMLALTVSLISIGVDLKTSILLINQPKIKEIVARNQAGEGSIGVLLNRAIKRLEAENDDVKELSIKVPVTTQMLIDNIQGTEQLDDVDQGAILKQFQNAYRLSRAVGDAQVLSTNSSFDYTSIEDISFAQDKLNNLGYKFTNKEFEKTKIPFDIRSLMSDPTKTFQGRYLRIFDNLTSGMPAVFSTQSPTFKKFVRTAKANIPLIPGKKLEKDILSYFISKAYLKALAVEKGNERLTISLNNSFIYPEFNTPVSIISVVDNIKKTLASMGIQNNFVNWIAKKDTKNPSNKAMINMVVGKTWTNLSSNAIVNLQNGLRDLYAMPELREDVRHLIHYLILKDGLQYTRDTFIDIIPVPLLDDILNVSGNITDLFNNEDIQDSQFVNLFGATRNELLKEFVEGYSNSRGITYFLANVRRENSFGQANAQIFTPTTKKKTRNEKSILLEQKEKDGPWQITFNTEHKVGTKLKAESRKPGRYRDTNFIVSKTRNRNINNIRFATGFETIDIMQDVKGEKGQIERTLVGYPQEIKMDVSKKNDKADYRTFKLTYLYTPEEVGNYEDMMNFNEFDIAFGTRAVYVESKSKGSMQQTDIGFVYGDRSTYEYLQNRKNVRDSGINNDQNNSSNDENSTAKKDPRGAGVKGKTTITATENKVTVTFDPATGEPTITIAEKSKKEDTEAAQKVPAQSIKVKAKEEVNADYSLIETEWDNIPTEDKNIIAESQNINNVEDAIARYKITNTLVPQSQQEFMDRLKKCK